MSLLRHGIGQKIVRLVVITGRQSRSPANLSLAASRAAGRARRSLSIVPLVVAALLAASAAPALPATPNPAPAEAAPSAAADSTFTFDGLDRLVAPSSSTAEPVPITPRPSLPTYAPVVNVGSPAIGGALETGAVLTAHPGTWRGPTPSSYTYEWLRCLTVSAVNTCETSDPYVEPGYIPTDVDIERYIRLRVTPWLPNGEAGPTAISPAVGPIRDPAAPFPIPRPIGVTLANVAAPIISGRPRVGEALDASEGLWYARTPVVAYTFQWMRCTGGSDCISIAGATTSTYLPTRADIGSSLYAEVNAAPDLALGPGPSSLLIETVVSDRTAFVTAPAGTLNAAPQVPNAISPDASNLGFTAAPVLQVYASDPDTDPLRYQFQLASDASFTEGVKASDWLETTSTFAVPPEWVAPGRRYFWRARAADGYGGESGWSSPREVGAEPAAGSLGLRDYSPLWSHGPLAVNQANGNLTVTLPAPSYPTAVGSLGVSLTYNSLETRDISGLGVGWTLAGGDGISSTPAKLIDHSRLNGDQQYNAIEIVWPDGSSDFYPRIGDALNYFPLSEDGSQLAQDRDGKLTLVTADGVLYSFGAVDAEGIARLETAERADAGRGQFTLVYRYEGGRLSKIAAVTPGAPAEREISFDWHTCAGAILCISGPDRTWRLVGESGGSGKLAELWNGTRRLVKLTYDTDGRPIKLQNANDLDPAAASAGYNQEHSLTISYDAATGRVTQVEDGPISAAHGPSRWTFAYNPASASQPVKTSPTRQQHGGLVRDTPRDAGGFTELTPPRQQGTGRAIRTYYDWYGQTMEVKDLRGNVSMAAFSVHHQLLWTEDAEGNPTDYRWDLHPNHVLEAETAPDSDGAGPLGRPTTSYRYDETRVGSATEPGPALQGLQAAYYDNPNLAGRPAARQTDANVDFNWGSGGPAALGGRADDFSIRWRGNLEVTQAGHYIFETFSDDGVTLTVGGQHVIGSWQQGPTYGHSSEIFLERGLHRLILDYHEGSTYDGVNEARVQLRWRCSSCREPFDSQVIPSSALRPAWLNRTSTVSPSGRIGFSHFAKPETGEPDYTLRRLGSANVITSFSYDSLGRLIQKVPPRGNEGRWIDAEGRLQGTPNSAYATSYSYYGAGATAGACGRAAVRQGQLLRLVDPPGPAATTSVYDSAGREISTSDGAGTTCLQYDADSRLSARTDGNGHTTRFAYDPQGNTLATTAADGSLSRTRFDEAGRAVAKMDANGQTTTFGYDAEGNLTQATSPLAKTTRYGYDEVGNKTSVTDPLDNTTRYGYDALNRLTTTTTPLGNRSTTAYDTHGRVVERIDPRGKKTTSAYNEEGELTSVTDPLSNVTRSSYDGLGRLVAKTDAKNRTTRYEYDLDGNQTRMLAADGGVTTIAYDAAGNKISLTDPLAHTTSYGYDAVNRLVRTTLPTGETEHVGYDAVGNRTSTTDAAGKTTIYTYDLVDRLIRVRTPLGAETETAYDAVGNVTSRTDPRGRRTTYTYDAANRQTKVTDPLLAETRTTYDDADRVSSRTDALNHTTSYDYDADGRQRSVTAPDGGVTTITYDAASNVIRRTDPLERVTSYGYDDLNRLVSKTDPLSRTWTYAYDELGNRIKVVDANGNATADPEDGTTSYGYDAADRMTSIAYSDATPDVSFTYDLAGRRTSISDGAGTQTYSYDDANRLTGVFRSGQSFLYAYDSAGRLSARSYPGGEQTSYGYDDDSRLRTVTSGLETTSYSYNAASELTETTLPNGWSEQRSYDAAGRISDIRSVKGTDTLAVATYTRDAVGNPTRIVRDGSLETYAYDASDRVTDVCYGGEVASCSTTAVTRYTYDKVGNRLTRYKMMPQGQYWTTYTYDAADQLTRSANGLETKTYAYDANGNQTSVATVGQWGSGSRSFSYDLANRLTRVQGGATTIASFSYDGLGNRLTKTAGAETTSYLWDENASLPQLALEKSGSTVLRSYVYGLELVAMRAGGSSHYLHHDALSSTAAVSSQAGAVEWKYTYEAFGANRGTTKVDPAAPDNPMRFTGELLDSETGLYNLRARLYDPETGRFLSTDPLPEGAGEPALGDYVYVADRPTVLTDPSGMRPDVGEGECVEWAQNGILLVTCDDGTRVRSSADDDAGDATNVEPDSAAVDPEEVVACALNPTSCAIKYAAKEAVSVLGNRAAEYCLLNVNNPVISFNCAVAAALKQYVDIFVLSWIEAGAPLDGGLDGDGSANALRHSLWSALVTLVLGPKETRTFAGLHEQDSRDRWGSEMDRHNNGQGIKVALEAMKNSGDLRQQMREVGARLIMAAFGQSLPPQHRAAYERRWGPWSELPDLWVIGEPGARREKGAGRSHCMYSLKTGRRVLLQHGYKRC